MIYYCDGAVWIENNVESIQAYVDGYYGEKDHTVKEFEELVGYSMPALVEKWVCICRNRIYDETPPQELSQVSVIWDGVDVDRPVAEGEDVPFKLAPDE